MKNAYDVTIIGSGIVGLAAAVYCGRMGMKTLILGKEPLGTIAKTDIVENYPGFKKISGIDLAKKIQAHAEQYKVKVTNAFVEKVTWSKKSAFVIKTKKNHYHSRTVLFATGSKWRKLKVPGEKEFTNKGVHYCALCDGPFYKNKTVAVVGGGDSAAKEALQLSTYTKQVYILARSKLKPEPINKKRVAANKKIKVIEGVQVKEIKGDKAVTRLVLDKKPKTLAVDGVFIDIGHIPLSSLATPLGVKLNKNKEIIIDKESKTNVKGVYAAGDVTDTKSKQAITGVGEAVKAVYGIYETLGNEEVLCSKTDENK